MAFHDDRLVFSLAVTWLVALCRHWGWDGEARRWTETLRVMECPEKTRACLFERARTLEAATQVRTAFAFA